MSTNEKRQLAAAAKKWHADNARASASRDKLIALVSDLCDREKVSEGEAAEITNTTRMTIRRWRGKDSR